jgi:phage terminase large subunit
MTASPIAQADLALKFIEQVRAEPVWFAEQVLNHRALEGEPTLEDDPSRSWELDQFQRDILEAVFDVWRKRQGIPTRINHDGCPFISVRSGHGPGKTHTAGLVAHTFCTAFPARVVAVAPKLSQLRTRVWGALRKIDARAEAWYRSTHVLNDSAVYWKRVNDRGRLVEDKNWCILPETASSPENLAGHHEQFQLVLVEEATGIKEHLFPVIFGALSTGVLQVLLMIANPTKNVGTFADSHLKAGEAKNYFRYHVSSKQSSRVSKKWIEAMATKYGTDSPYYRIRVLGEFADAGERQLIALQYVIDAIEYEPLRSDGSIPRLRVSVDVADGGLDETIVGVGKHWDSKTGLLYMKRYNFPQSESPIRAAEAAEKAFKDYGGDRESDDFVVDSLGVGAGTAGWLMDKGYKVITYQGGAGSDDKSRWRNRRAQSYINLRDAFRDGTLQLSPDLFDDPGDWEDLQAQLCSIELRPGTSERVDDLLSKDDMKRKGIKSPDMADCLAMQFATQSPRLSVTGGIIPPRERRLIVHRGHCMREYFDHDR